MSDGRERRRAPRSNTRFAVRNIRHDDTEAEHSEYCETRNISRNGAYCLSEKPFPEFARIKITLELGENHEKDLECEGVVVRADGTVQIDGKEMHAFALFFDRMSEDDRCKIDTYVETHQHADESNGQGEAE